MVKTLAACGRILLPDKTSFIKKNKSSKVRVKKQLSDNKASNSKNIRITDMIGMIFTYESTGTVENLLSAVA